MATGGLVFWRFLRRPAEGAASRVKPQAAAAVASSAVSTETVVLRERHPSKSASNWSSVRTGTPSSRALVSLLPAFSPATT
jgi:hypothetical protein